MAPRDGPGAVPQQPGFCPKLDLGLCPPRPCLQEELDLSCTFVFKARQKAGVRLPAPGREKPPGTDTERGRNAPGKVSQDTGGAVLGMGALPVPWAPSAASPPGPRAPGHQRRAAEPGARRSVPGPRDGAGCAQGPLLPRLGTGAATGSLSPVSPPGAVLPTGQGNAAALRGRYPEAVRAFTAALQLNPREHR